MLALRLNGKNIDPVLTEFERGPIPEGFVDVRLRAAALNHRDVWIQKGLYANIQFPFTPGSDGAGWLEDQPVLINPGMQWGDNPQAQGTQFQILGMPSDGTFAQRVYVPAEQVYPAPNHLSLEEAAAIPLAGVTAFRALFTQGEAKSTDRILVTGIGGGVAQWAFQFAKALDAEIWVTSGTGIKLKEALKQGAAGGFLYHDAQWKELAKASGGFDVVIDGAGGPFIGEIMKSLNPGARVVIYGGTVGPITHIVPQLLFWKQIKLIGSTMGSPDDFEKMLAFITQYNIVPVIDGMMPLEDGAKAYQRMAGGLQSGKIILQIPDL